MNEKRLCTYFQRQERWKWDHRLCRYNVEDTIWFWHTCKREERQANKNFSSQILIQAGACSERKVDGRASAIVHAARQLRRLFCPFDKKKSALHNILRSLNTQKSANKTTQLVCLGDFFSSPCIVQFYHQASRTYVKSRRQIKGKRDFKHDITRTNINTRQFCSFYHRLLHAKARRRRKKQNKIVFWSENFEFVYVGESFALAEVLISDAAASGASYCQ